MNNNKVATPKLETDGSNWGMYHNRMCLILCSRKCGDHLTLATLTVTYQTHWPAINARQLQVHWESNEILVMSLITSSLPDGIFSLVKNKVSVHAQWDALKKKYETHSSNHCFDLCSKLMNTCCLEGGNIHEVFDQLAIIQQQLASAGVNIRDEEFASILCNSLPKSYESIIPGITTVGESKTITSDIVLKFALEAYDHKIATGEVTAETITFAVSGGKESKKRKATDQGGNSYGWHGQQSNRWRGGGLGHTRGGQGRGGATGCSHEPLVCWNCGKPGHIEVWCRTPRGGSMGHTGGGKDERQSKRRKHNGGGKKKTTAHIVEDADLESESDEDKDIEEEDNKVAMNVLEEWVMITTTSTAMDKVIKANLYNSGVSRHISPF